ncbi:MAG: folylpolyglutamate synthase/dihydrofolate synthase family protein [Cyanobacteria bacterium J06598_1]
MSSPPNSPTADLQQSVESQLKSYARFGVDLGLDRIKSVLSNLGDPQKSVPVIHVAGTNGKGSVCAYLSSILTTAGYRTGRYTSPHLVNWTERICIDGQPISWSALQTQLNTVENAVERTGPIPTQFEIFTAAAWQYFAAQAVDIAIVEVGLGGRLDATNVCDRPLATIIVSISRDHWQRLGNTLGEIAGEKAGILKAEVDAIAGPLPNAAAAVVQQKADSLNTPLTWVTPATTISSTKGDLLTYNDITYRQTLLGDHQKVNSACAIAAIQSLRRQGWSISDEAITQGMRHVRWPGRLQKAQWQGHNLLIDGAHNLDAAQSLRTYIDNAYANQPITWLIGMLETKDHSGVFKALLRPADRLHLVPVPGHLSADVDALRAIAQKTCPGLNQVQTHLSIESALPVVVQTQPTDSPTVLPTVPPTVLCGSLYLIGHFYETLYTGWQSDL